jgi:hypothetical protein
MSSHADQLPRIPGQVSLRERPEGGDQPVKITHKSGVQSEHEYENANREAAAVRSHTHKPVVARYEQ